MAPSAEGAARGPAADGAGRSIRAMTVTLRHRGVDAPEEALSHFAAELADTFSAEAVLRTSTGAEGPAGVRLSLPVSVRGDEVAHLDLLRDTPFDAREREILGYAVQLIGDRMSQLSLSIEMSGLVAITTALTTADDVESGAASFLDLVLAYTGAASAMLLRDASVRLEVLGTAGTWGGEGLPAAGRDLVRGCLGADGPIALAEGAAAVRLGTGSPYRYALVLHFPPSRPMDAMRLPVLVAAADKVAPHLESLWRDQVHVELLKFHRHGDEASTDDLYARLLDTAIRLVHGADSGTLLIRRGRDEPFVFQAARGFDDEALAGVSVGADEARAWYGADDPGWDDGRPRILHGDRVDLPARSASASPTLARHGSGVERIRSSLCLPVLHEGDVMAILNLDNQRDSAAFGQDSRTVVDLFGAPLADLLHRHDFEDRLREAAVTDPLTGLGNRRPLTTALQREMARHRRSGVPVSVLILDLTDFKGINDELGHDVGDEALVRVARALRAEVRTEDVLARWGGDEFAVALTDASPAVAAKVAARLTAAVHGIEVRGRRIGVDVGAASAPEDGEHEDDLLRRADDRMYENKRRGRTRG